ncbi:MAG: hypothetical protein LQ340_003719 [Diploschistes diacapsis]|nr:MAG: hypothetical protein LQ340_003719 [Diploschistes diacapsis]
MPLSVVTAPIRGTFPTSSTPIDPYDHEISLQDATSTPKDQASPTRSAGPSTEIARATTGEHSLRGTLLSKTAMKEEYTRRKYARFQEDRYAEGKDLEASPTSMSTRGKPTVSRKSEAVKRSLDAHRGRLLERLHFRSKRAARAKEKESTTDILYENQRGLFLFGYPFYSSRSLLNFDPSPWTNVDFQDSPVDIRNAQVPDPTWIWSWKRWYVDMTDDVDEEGWQYSLSFGRRFSWHGTHPWFHSSVRRRRWLRKRVKIAPHHETGNKAHDFTQDYFTIHSARRESSRGSSIERGGGNRSSYFGTRLVSPEDSESEEEYITNVASLLKEMKKTTIDRKKLDHVKNFVSAGGDELAFLPDTIPEVLGMFMYQNSRRQVLEVLESALHESEWNDKEAENSPVRSPGGEEAPPAGSLRVEGIRKSIQVVHSNIKHIEYYSDARAMEQQFHQHDDDSYPDVAEPISDPAWATNRGPHHKGNHPPTSALASPEPETLPTTMTTATDPKNSRPKALDINEQVSRVEIKGIPNSAGVDVEPGIMRPLGFMRDGREDGSEPRKEREKEKEKEKGAGRSGREEV